VTDALATSAPGWPGIPARWTSSAKSGLGTAVTRDSRVWVGDYKGTPMLLAERENYALALASTAPWLARSVGFVGFSDGWQQLRAFR